MDGSRRICLVHDQNAVLDAADAAFFDDYAVLKDDPLYPGFMNKIRVYGTSPYKRTMFIDADCLMIKRDIGTYWNAARSHVFAITGTRRVQGEWKGSDIRQLLIQEGAPYLVQMNSGVFCFDNSPQAAKFFSGLNDFYLRRKDHLCVGLHRGKRAQTDEIYIGLWMGLNGLDSYGSNVGENSWMVSTWRAFWMQLNPAAGTAVLRKPRRSVGGIPNPIGGWDRLSPTLVHFVGLKPQSAYARTAAYFRTLVAH